MAIVVRCQRCEKDHEIDDSVLEKNIIDCPFCNNTASKDEFSAIMFCPHCYAELHVPLDVIHKELQCPYCDKTFRSNISFSLAADDDEDEKIFDDKPVDMLSPGDVFDKYKIIRLLGKGGMGEVYLAQHMLLNREIALKILNSGAASSNQVYAKRFIREAKLANRINSENFIAVFDAGMDSRSGSLFIAMEYVDGRNLNEIMHTEGTFAEKDILQIALNVTNVLAILEQENIVHRDIKPSNIMISSDGVVKLADFGIAKSENSDENDLTLTQGNMVFGTPNYASPEQCRSSHHVDFRSDIYSLGATMFHMAAGAPPYEGSTAMETVLKVLNEEPRDLNALVEGFSPGFILLVKDMLKRDPEKRPPSAGALKMRIEHLLRGHQSLSVRLKYGSRILWSQLSFIFSEIVKFMQNVAENFPRKAFKRFIKTVIIMILLFIGVIMILRYRNVFIKGYDYARKAVVKFSSPETAEKKTAGSHDIDKKEQIEPAPKIEKTVEKKSEPVKNVSEKKVPAPKTAVRKERKKQRRKRFTASADVKKAPVKKGDNRFYHDKLRRSIFARLEKCNKEFAALRAAESSYTDRSLYIARVEFYKRLQKNLLDQLKKRERAFYIKSSKGFHSDLSASIAAMVHEYSKNEHGVSFSPEEKIFAQQLLHYVKNPKSDPNVLIKDARHPKFSGPLLRWIEHAKLPMKKEIEKELMLHHVSADCITGDCSIELCKYGIISMKGMLNLSIKEKKFDNAMTLIEYGADVNETDSEGRTPLHWAVLYDNMKVTRQLLLAGAEVNAKDKKNGQTPVFYAEKYASKEIFDLLRTFGADENIQDARGQYYQHYTYVRDFNNAMKENELREISLLLNNHQELSNMEMSGGLMPLQYACMNNMTSVVLELLKNKADVNAVSGACPYTPLQLSYEYPEDRKQSDAVRLSRWGMFTSLLQNGANAAVPPITGNYPTLLQFSLSDVDKLDERHMYFVSSLIRSYDTSLELVPLLGRMYRHETTYYSNDKNTEKRKRILAQLLLKKPDLNQKRFDSLIPLIAWSPKLTEGELDSILKCGARINGKDKYGRNALYVLCTYISRTQSYLDGKSMQLQIDRIKYLLKKGIDKKCKVNNISIPDIELPELIMPLLK